MSDGIYNLMKLGTMIFSRNPYPAIAALGALQDEQKNKAAYTAAADPFRQLMSMSGQEPRQMAVPAQRKAFNVTTFDDSGKPTGDEAVAAGPQSQPESFRGLPATSFNGEVGGSFSAQDYPQAVKDFLGRGNDLQSNVFSKLMSAPGVQKNMMDASLNRMTAAPTIEKGDPGTVFFRKDPRTGAMTPVAAVPALPVKSDLVTLGKQGAVPIAQILAKPSNAAQRPKLERRGYSEAKTPAAQVNVNNTQEGKFGQTMGEIMAKEYSGIQNAGRTAADQSTRLNYLSGLLDQVNTGTGAPTITAIMAGMQRLGIDPKALGIDGNVGAAQAAQVITNQMALDLRSTANGGGMPGAMSDSDRKFLMEMPPGIEKTPEGNRQIIQYWQKMKQREAQLALWARDYKRSHNGVYDEGFYDYAAKKSAENPLFEAPPKKAETPAPATPPSVTGPPVGTILNGYKFNGGNPNDQKNWSKVN